MDYYKLTFVVVNINGELVTLHLNIFLKAEKRTKSKENMKQYNCLI